MKLEYEIGSYNQFRIEIAFFRGVDEGEGSYFVIDNIQVLSPQRAKARVAALIGLSCPASRDEIGMICTLIDDKKILLPCTEDKDRGPAPTGLSCPGRLDENGML